MSGSVLPTADRLAILSKLRSVLEIHSRGIWACGFWYLTTTIASLAMPPILGRMVEDSVTAANGVTTSTFYGFTCYFAGLLLIQTISLRQGRLTARKVGETVVSGFREDFISRILGLPFSSADAIRAGDLMSRTTRDVDVLGNNARFAVPEVLTALLQIALTLTAICVLNPWLFLPCIVAMPIFFTISRWYVRRAPAAYLEESRIHAEVNDGVIETVGGARTAEALRRGPFRTSRTDADIADAFSASTKTLRLRSVWLPIIGLGNFIVLPGMLLVGGLLYRDGQASIGELTTLAIYAQQLSEPINRISHYLNDLFIGHAALSRLLGVPDNPRNPAEHQMVGPADLVLSNVHFSYSTNRPVLWNIDLTIAAGEKFALVGPSGAGKSTLAKIIGGTYVPTSGEVTVRGVSLGELPNAELRRQVALLTQEHHLFACSLRDNVALARPDATDEEVASALETVNALVWVDKLKLGIHTEVGASGSLPTLGQAQQIAMARLLLAAPAIVVLDEATSFMGLGTAKSVERSFNAVMNGRTVISVAHRLHSALNADRIAVMENGRIVELGSHTDLLSRGGVYARLWDSWIYQKETDHTRLNQP